MDRYYINEQGERGKYLELKDKKILITGAAGFIGYHLVSVLLQKEKSIHIIGIDNINDYYDISIKEYRLKKINEISLEYFDCSWSFLKGDISDKQFVCAVFKKYKPDIVINLAAQAGVRYSIINPDVYIESNLIGFYNILEACRNSCIDNDSVKTNEYQGVQHLIYASSSSVYGENKKVPYSTEDKVDNPVSLYAATKKTNELMAHVYSKIYNIPSTGLRFFSVYGPAGRPDMAYFKFTDQLRKGEKIQIYNYGNCKRDFTYIADAVECILRVISCPPMQTAGEDGLRTAPYAIYNIGNQKPEKLLDFVEILQKELVDAEILPKDYDFEALKEYVPMQQGDTHVTYADTTTLERDFGFRPKTNLREGVHKFVEWYKDFYKL